MTNENIFHTPPKPQKDEYFNILLKNKNIVIEKVVSYGLPTPPGIWLDQKETEWVCVLEGQGEILFFNGEKKVMEKGSSLLIEAGKKHRVEKVSNPCVWLAVKYL